MLRGRKRGFPQAEVEQCQDPAPGKNLIQSNNRNEAHVNGVTEIRNKKIKR